MFKSVTAANPLVVQVVVRHLPSTETTRDQSLVVALIERDLGWVCVCLALKKQTNKQTTEPTVTTYTVNTQPSHKQLEQDLIPFT